MPRSRLITSLLIACIAGTFFIPFLGGVHLFDWDEINFAEIAREMIVTGNYFVPQIDFQPFWQKPPLFIWMQAAAMKMFGMGEFAARFPNAICGMLTLVLLFNIGAKLKSVRFGLIWALSWFGSILPFLYFKSGIIDPWFNFFIFLGLYFLILFYWKKEWFQGIELKRSKAFYLFFAGLFIGLGVLTKGPVAFLIVSLTLLVYWLLSGMQNYLGLKNYVAFALICAAVAITWFAVEIWKTGFWFVEEFTLYQWRLFSTPDAGHRGFFGYHLVVLFFGCFPASVFAIRAFLPMPGERFSFQQDFKEWMMILFWVVLILFSIVKSKIVHYSSLCYFPLTYLAAVSIEKILGGRIIFSGWMKALLAGIAVLFAIAIVLAISIAHDPSLVIPLIKDPFAVENLKSGVTWSGAECVPLGFLVFAFFLIAVLITRRKLNPGLISLFLTNAVFISLILIFFAPKIEQYVQGAAIEFYEEKAGEDCYIVTHGFKSYAHLFYAKKQPSSDPRAGEKDWLMNGETEKPVYLVAKIQKAPELRENPSFRELYSKNGFVFFRKE